jgi:hypothetical protein
VAKWSVASPGVKWCCSSKNHSGVGRIQGGCVSTSPSSGGGNELLGDFIVRNVTAVVRDEHLHVRKSTRSVLEHGMELFVFLHFLSPLPLVSTHSLFMSSWHGQRIPGLGREGTAKMQMLFNSHDGWRVAGMAGC